MINGHTFNEEDTSVARDYSGNGNDITWGTAPSFVSGDVGSAAKFDESAEGEGPSGLYDGLSDFTVYGKIKVDSGGSGNDFICQVADQLNILYDHNNGNLKIDLTNDSSDTGSLTISANTDEWIKFVGLFDGANLEFYVGDNNTSDSTALSGTMKSVDNSLLMGKSSLDSGKFNGQIEELKFFDVSASSDQRQSLFDTDTGFKLEISTQMDWRLGDIVESGVSVCSVGMLEVTDSVFDIRLIPLTTYNPGGKWVRRGHLWDSSRQTNIVFHEPSGDKPKIQIFDGVSDSDTEKADRLVTELSGKGSTIGKEERTIYFQHTNGSYNGYEADMLADGDDVKLTVFIPTPFSKITEAKALIVSEDTASKSFTVNSKNHIVGEDMAQNTGSKDFNNIDFTADQTKEFDISSLIGNRKEEMTGLTFTTNDSMMWVLGTFIKYET